MIIDEQLYFDLGFEPVGYKTAISGLQELMWYKIKGEEIYATQSDFFPYTDLVEKDCALMYNKSNAMLISHEAMKDKSVFKECLEMLKES